MASLQRLADEFDHETAVTRKMLARLPDAQFGWRPHPKSFTAGGLACHIVESVGWARPILTAAEFDLDPASYRPFEATSQQALLDGLDRVAAAGRVAFTAANEAALDEPWRLLIGGRRGGANRGRSCSATSRSATWRTIADSSRSTCGCSSCRCRVPTDRAPTRAVARRRP